jgi:hypothetical protein
MTIEYDKEFGPNGIYGWPASLQIAESLLELAPSEKSTADCLTDEFFYQQLDYIDAPLFYDYTASYTESDALELAELAGKSRKELFKAATKWPLSYLVTSATYKILSARDEGVYMIGPLGDCFFWSFLSFKEPLFGMLQSKDWGKIYGNDMRKGFYFRLRHDIGVFTMKKFVWGSDKEKPWFTCVGFPSHFYSEDILRCLDLVGVDPGLAQSAVEKVFKLQSLTPLCNVLSDDPSSTLTTVAKDRRSDEEGKGEEGETKTLKKPGADLQIHVRNSICGALLVAGVFAGAATRPRSKWASTQPVLAFTQPCPCFAATRAQRWNRTVDPPLAVANQPLPERPEFATGARTTASRKPRSQRLWAAFKKLNLSRTKSPDLISRQNTKKMWRIANALQSGASTQPLRRDKSAAAYLRQAFSDVKTEIQRMRFKLYEIVINKADGLWINNGRVFTEGSTQVKDLRSKLKESGKLLPDGTSLCIHVQRTPEGLKFTGQGTRTEFNSQRRVMNWIEADFLVDGASVVQGAALEIDHIWGTKVANLGDLRSSTPTYDVSYTVRLTPALHKLRTSYFRAIQPKYDLGKLTQPLSEVVKSMAEADKKLWGNKKHRAAIFKDGVTPKFLLQQYADGHRYQVSRMARAIDQSGFSSRQATAYVANEVAREGIAKAADNFVDCRVPMPKWRGEMVLPEYVREGAARCYREEVRQLNLRPLGKYFSQCIQFLDDFETYAYSQAGAMDGCTAFQVRQHRDTKIEAIYLYGEALKKGFQGRLINGSMSQTDLDNEVNIMLANANVDRNGNPTAIPLPTEALKARIKTEGEALQINSLYLRDNSFTLTKPKDKDAITMYEECVKNEARNPKKASTSHQQDASTSYQRKASDQDDRFLP